MATWGDRAAQHLLDFTVCPRCDSRLRAGGLCERCGADLSGDAGVEIWEASKQAAEALRSRELLVAALPAERATVAAPARAERPVFLPPRDVPAREGSSVSIQSVLAVAGAGLLAVAAIVFTFLNPDLTDFATRTLIIVGITAVFLGGAWALARAKLQFSAESVGALGAVFVALDLWALSQVAPVGVSGWWPVAVGTLVGSVGLIVLARAARIRTWSWAGILGVALTPAFVGYAVNTPWTAILGHLVAGFAALALHELVKRLAPRFTGPLDLERVTLTVLQGLATVLVLGELLFFAGSTILAASGVVLALAAMALLSTRNEGGRFWSFVSGALGVTAIAILPLLLTGIDLSWMLALIPLAAALALVALSAVPLPAFAHRPTLVLGAWTPALLTALPAVGMALLQLLRPQQPFAGLVSLLGLLAVALGSAGMGSLMRAHPRLSERATTTALWLGVLAVVTLELWTALPPAAQAGIGVAIALGATWLLLHLASGWPAWQRAALFFAAHAVLLIAALITWFEPSLAVAGGALVAAALLVVSRAVPVAIRPLHVALSYAWALAVFAHGLALVHVEPIAILCLTTTLASLGALAATLVHRLPARAWYAILLVTSVPFVLGITSVIAERSGWTALSTGVTFLLAATLVTTRRPGLNRAVRTLAAGLLVPALAVVVICLGAQVLLVSASPITLPVIAAIVAVALPSTAAIGRALVARGIPDADARAARIAIEVSSLLTAAIAVLLALVRAAAGLGTSFTVLVILGVGAAVAGLLTRRRYAWAVSALSFTGALWSLLALLGVGVLEPYVLPPALGAALVGAVLAWRGFRGRELYAIGLGAGILSVLGALAVLGQSDAYSTWRVVGLLAGSALLVLGGALVRRVPSLRVPTLLAAILAASGGIVQAIRFGTGADVSVIRDAVMIPVLGLTALAVALAVASGLVLARLRPSRWVYAPAVLFAVIGPITASRHTWFSIITLFVLALALLALLLVTVVRARTRDVTLPPVWFLFAAAWLAAVSSWSQRELRVEAYSLPLGLALVAAGVIASRSERTGGTLASWPVGYRGSWRLLAPGILVTFVPSILATGTDPRTERAILVIVLALAAILIGSLRKLAAPFILGVIVLPVENLVVFLVRLGRSIEAAPWWITLATAGAVLLVIAVTSERRASGARGVAARLRDLT
ncbi:MAG: hypothetical protein JWR04_3133 [Rhodoglobus sp.]|nr:hypothetical protein [Rhodoglobus sp.]